MDRKEEHEIKYVSIERQLLRRALDKIQLKLKPIMVVYANGSTQHSD
jgi:hypothetical protein